MNLRRQCTAQDHRLLGAVCLALSGVNAILAAYFIVTNDGVRFLFTIFFGIAYAALAAFHRYSAEEKEKKEKTDV